MKFEVIDNFYKRYEITPDHQKKLDNWEFARAVDKRSMIINAATKAVAEMFMYYCPPSKELNSALINLEIAMVNANLAIIEHEIREHDNSHGGIVKDYR